MLIKIDYIICNTVSMLHFITEKRVEYNQNMLLPLTHIRGVNHIENLMSSIHIHRHMMKVSLIYKEVIFIIM